MKTIKAIFLRLRLARVAIYFTLYFHTSFVQFNDLIKCHALNYIYVILIFKDLHFVHMGKKKNDLNIKVDSPLS